MQDKTVQTLGNIFPSLLGNRDGEATMSKHTIRVSCATYFIYFSTEKRNKELVFQPSIKCVTTVRKKKKKFFEKVFSLHVQSSEVNYSLRLSRCFLRVQLQIIHEAISGVEGRGPLPVRRRYFSLFVNNGDVNCGRFDRAFERAVTTVTFTRDVSRSLRLPPFMTLVNGTSCRVEEKRETRNVSDTR